MAVRDELFADLAKALLPILGRPLTELDEGGAIDIIRKLISNPNELIKQTQRIRNLRIKIGDEPLLFFNLEHQICAATV